MSKPNKQIDLKWDHGTAFDFFISLQVLHDPEYFGLRSSWAAGMRQRLPRKDREILAKFIASVGQIPQIEWLLSLPAPKDSRTALDAFAGLSLVERVMVFVDFTGEFRDAIREVVTQGRWGKPELDALQEYYRDEMKITVSTKKNEHYLNGLANSLALVNGVSEGLQTYYEMFFEEEERRIIPAVERGLVKTQEMAARLDLPELLQELSEGVRFPESFFEDLDSLTLIPSFWISPRIVQGFGDSGSIIFGIRPEDTSLIPGEIIPDILLSALDALANPTRLKILRYLASEELTATQIAAKLRLRPPTVVHHLKTLRLAGLVYIFSPKNQKEVYYKTRVERVEALSSRLVNFILDHSS